MVALKKPPGKNIDLSKRPLQTLLTDKSLSKHMGLQPQVSTNFALLDQRGLFRGRKKHSVLWRVLITVQGLWKWLFLCSLGTTSVYFYSLKKTFGLGFHIWLWMEQGMEAFCYSGPTAAASCRRKMQIYCGAAAAARQNRGSVWPYNPRADAFRPSTAFVCSYTSGKRVKFRLGFQGSLEMCQRHSQVGVVLDVFWDRRP